MHCKVEELEVAFCLPVFCFLSTDLKVIQAEMPLSNEVNMVKWMSLNFTVVISKVGIIIFSQGNCPE